MKCLFTLFLVLITFPTHSQPTGYDPNQPPSTFRSKDNPYYWKNRPPFEGYWQQDVYYEINASINEKTDIIDGIETLTYWNNSPDTLRFVYFHLYQQAFVKGGHLENLNLNNNFKQTFGKYEAAGLGEIVESIQSNGEALKTESDFSVMKVYLTKPLLPNDSTQFNIKFKTYFDIGTQRRRMKKFSAFGYTQYDGVHWYPRICVYDRKFGWDTDQHLGKEFYGDFGTYDVKLTFASNYIVGATGTLLNQDEVLPPDLRQKLDLKNFASKKWESKPSVIIPYDSTQRKTWHFYAQNVHDFAWVADPTFRIGELTLQVYDATAHSIHPVLCQALAQEQHAAGWQDAALLTARVIDIYSKDFGAYAWPKIIVADARDGMEYPMLTLDGGFAPNYYDLIAHEVGHEWFFGQVGNNETYRAALDEGFAQFIESWSLIKIFGDTLPANSSGKKFNDRFKKVVPIRDGEVYLGYLRDASKGVDESINQHSDAFNGALNHGGGYSQVYFKTATMLYNLQYVLGDSLFKDAMKHYCDQWKFCHPYFEDFRNSMIQFTHVDLNWFFDEWMETTKTIDYKIKGVKHIDGDEYVVNFKRRGRSQMPIDFEVQAKDDKSYSYYIPNTWFQKSTTATILPKWYGWDKLHPTYSCTLTIPSGIKNVVIDPTYRLADIYMLDNSKKFPAEISFDSQIYNTPTWRNYQMLWRPDIWYNAVDGLKIGGHLEGDYFGIINKFSLTAWFNTTLLQDQAPIIHEDSSHQKVAPVSFNFSYSSNTHWFIKNSAVDFSLKYLDGLWGGSAGFTIQVNAKNTIGVGIKSMYRPKERDLSYLLYPDLWIANSWNNTANINFGHKYQYFKGNGDINIQLRSSSLFSNAQYADATMVAINRTRLAKFDLSTRLFVRAGSGTPAPESMLYLAGESPEEMMDNKFVRSKAFVPYSWLGYDQDINHFQQGGGMNLRGFAGFLAPEKNKKDGNTYYVYYGTSGVAANAELDFDNYIKFAPKFLKSWLKLDSYVFADAGSIGYRSFEDKFYFSKVRADAGIGLAMTIKKWGPLEKVKPFTLRADFPFYVSQIPEAENSNFAFRWVIGVGRTF